MTSKHYSKAPVIEAVIGLQTQFDSGYDPSRFAVFGKELKSEFVTQLPIHQFQMELGPLSVDPTAISQLKSAQAIQGFRLENGPKTRVIQAQLSGFTFSHLPPYSEWSQFRTEASTAWQTFVDVCQPRKVTRVGVRFINKIAISETKFKIEEYFNLYPKTPDTAVDQEVNGFFMQLQLPQADLDCVATVSQAIVKPKNPNISEILLDIDIFKQCNYDPSDGALWQLIDAFRLRKNEIFESSITDKVREAIA